VNIRTLQSEHWAAKDLKIIESYWSSPPATKRSLWFVEQLKQYDFDSIFEIGFFSGRNLKYIQEAFPKISVGGLEINKQAVKFAQEKLPNTSLLHINLHDMNKITTKYDIVFSSGVLIHLDPNDLNDVAKKCIGLANKYVMHLEQLGRNEVVAGPKHLKPIYKISDQMQWNPDLMAVYSGLGYTPQIISLPQECKTNGAAELVVIKI